MAVLYRLGSVFFFYYGQTFLFYSLLKAFVSQHKTGMCDHVSRLLLMQKRRALFHGCLRIQDHRIFFILHFDLIRCPPGCDLILRDDSRNIIPVHADPSV